MKMKRMAMLWLALCLLLSCVWTATAEGGEVDWTEEERARLRVGSTTPLQGRFFTSMWGAATSDLDVQELLHAWKSFVTEKAFVNRVPSVILHLKQKMLMSLQQK